LLNGASVDELLRDDPGRKLIRPIVEGQHAFRNLASSSPLAFGAIDGHEVPERFIECCPVPDGPAEVVLVTDGYFTPAPSLAAAERQLREVLATDPLLIGEFASTKGWVPGSDSYDDRAYVRFAA
jgi:hypothetical protein